MHSPEFRNKKNRREKANNMEDAINYSKNKTCKEGFEIL